KGGDSVFLSLHKKARAFFGPIEQWLLGLPKAFLKWIIDGIGAGLNFIQERFTAFKEWLLGIVTLIGDRLSGLFDNLLPDFLKKGFSGTINPVPANNPDSPSLNTSLAPSPSQVSHQNRISSQQNVNVAVNVKSDSDPHEIGDEVSKAIKQALERERFNA